MSILDRILPWRRRRAAKEAQAKKDYEDRGLSIINNFYRLLEERTEDAKTMKGHTSPGAGRFSGIAPECFQLIETWRATVGDGITGEALERVEAEMQTDLDIIQNFYNSEEAATVELQERTFTIFSDLLDRIIRELSSTVSEIEEAETPEETETTETAEKPQRPRKWFSRFFNFFTGRK